MVKKILPKKNPPEEVDIVIDSDQWETQTPFRFTWRHGLLIALLIGGGILFAFGFLIIAVFILLAALIINILAFIVKKIT